MQPHISMKYIQSHWDEIRTSLWFVPTALVFTAAVVAFSMIEIDHAIQAEDIQIPDWVFGSSADGARTLLSTIAGSLVTIVGVVFSITIVVLQQAASQFTPRVMGNFIRQTGTQFTLGIYLATFLYALLIIRSVRSHDAPDDQFIPRLSIAFALVLATVCLGFLVYFIHHMATSLQASMVISNVNREFREDTGPLYPEHIGFTANDRDLSLESFRREYMPVPNVRIEAEESGYLLSVDEEAILANVPETTGIAILPQIGDFVIRGTPVIEISGYRQLEDDDLHRIFECVELGTERSRFQDPMFSIRQLVDIALKALSPSINDPTTANNAISMLGDCISVLADRKFPDRVRAVRRGEEDHRGDVQVSTNRPSFDAYVDAAFSEIRREALRDVAVSLHLADTIGALGDAVKIPGRAEPLHTVLTDLLRGLERTDFDRQDVEKIRAHVDEARRRLLGGGPSDPA